jgi:hypothetical protein
LTAASKCAWPFGEDISMFITLPDAPAAEPTDGQTVTSPTPARRHMPVESTSRATIHSTGSPFPTQNAMWTAYGSSLE